MKRQSFKLCALIAISGACASVDYHINRPVAPVTSVLIGQFEKRGFDYNPFVAKNLREALGFEFFRRGVEVRCPSEPSASPDAASIESLCKSAGADLYLQGSCWEITTGEIMEPETVSSVTVLLFDRSGKKIGEARREARGSLSSPENTRCAASDITREILAAIRHE